MPIRSAFDDDRRILTRPGIGATGGVRQRCDLRLDRIRIDQPTLIVVRHGLKEVQSLDNRWIVRTGEAIAAAGQTLDIINRPSAQGYYDARWLVWDWALIASPPIAAPTVAEEAVHPLGLLDNAFMAAFDRAQEALACPDRIPDDIARHRLSELLIWLGMRGITFRQPHQQSLPDRIRGLVSAGLDHDWQAPAVARSLGVSEATLRRHLAAEGTSFGEVLTEARMARAMSLLQATDDPINLIALDVGYQSPSRFAVRFRRRFGFPPSAIRGHRRDGALAV